MERLAALPDEWSGLDWVPTGIGLGMLSWWGADHESWYATAADGTRVIAKAPRPHAVGSPAVAARIAAAEVGVGPAVLAAAPEAGVSVEAVLGEQWRILTLLRVQLAGAVPAIAAARRRFRESAVALPPRDLGAEAAAMLDDIEALGSSLSPVLAPVAAALEEMRAAVASGPAPAPSWLSSEISDVQLGPDGAVKFTGGTVAGLADPLADVGAILTELAPTAITPEAGFAVLWGDDHPGAYARARIWGVIADLRACLAALVAAGTNPGSPLDYATYTPWRSWHAEHPVRTGELDTLITAAKRGWS